MSFRAPFIAILLGSVTVVTIRALALTVAPHLSGEVGAPGTVDFVQYWSAFQLLMSGQNPYDGIAMHGVQTTVGQSPVFTTLMWNPPWTPIILAPIVSLPFSAAVVGWIVVSIGCLTGIVFALPTALGLKPPPPWVSGLAVLLMYPVAENLVLGQLAIFLTTILVLVMYLRAHHRYLLAGFFASVLSIKPHLFFLLAVPVAYSLIEAPRRVFVQSFLGLLLGASLLIGATWYVAPSAVTWWFDAFTVAPTGPGAVATGEWKTATLVTTLRQLLAEPNGAVPHWPLVVIPLLALVGTGCVMWKSKTPLPWQHVVPPLLCLSLLLGPYGWLYDQTLLVICQGDIVIRWWSNRPEPRLRAATGALACIQLFALLVGTTTDAPQEAFRWLPMAILIVWLFTRAPSNPAATSSLKT